MARTRMPEFIRKNDTGPQPSWVEPFIRSVSACIGTQLGVLVFAVHEGEGDDWIFRFSPPQRTNPPSARIHINVSRILTLFDNDETQVQVDPTGAAVVGHHHGHLVSIHVLFEPIMPDVVVCHPPSKDVSVLN